MAADHPETGSATIHLVDLLDVLYPANALFSLPEVPVLVCEWIFRFLDGRFGFFLINREFVMSSDLRRKQLAREIERDARFGFSPVLGEPLFHQLRELRIMAL